MGETPQEYVPGRCNIGYRGRAMRLATGVVVLGLSVVAALLIPTEFRGLRLFLVVPAYGGFLSVLEGSVSFCVFHASRGTYDLSERIGLPWGGSKTRGSVGSEKWRREDRRKARLMHIEAVAAAVLFGALLLVF